MTAPTENASASLRDRARGALLGAALGDALGAPFEGQPAVDAGAVLARLEDTGPLRWTDDTALMVALADYLIRMAGTGAAFDDDALIATFAAAWSADPDRGYGSGPPRIFAAVNAGRCWRATAAGLFGGSGSFGNGGAMRVAPVALTGGPLAAVAELARCSARVTHTHPLGQSGAAVQAVAVHLALSSEGPPRPDGFVQKLLPVADGPLADARAAIPILLRAGATTERATTRLGNGVSAVESVPTAVLAFLAFPDRPLDALTFAVCCGGDTDTIAAMTGAMAGARRGASALPGALLSRLEDAEHIARLAEALIGGRRRER